MRKDREEDRKMELDEQEGHQLFEHYKFHVDPKQEPLRIDKFLMNRIERVSRNKLQNAAKAGSILVNQDPVKSNYKVRPGDNITIVLAEPPGTGEIIPENIPLNILHEDDDLVVVDKTAGLVVHPGVGNYSGTLVNGLAHHFGENSEEPGEEFRPGLVHRIDKNTTGLLVIAKNDYAMTFLAKQFFQRTIKRSYLALVWGDFENEEGTITGNIGRNLRYRKKMAVFPEADHGKHAVTHYKVIERFHYVSLIQCKLETGRTHQIRVHMSHDGHPVFNDDTYGGDKIVKGTVYSKYKQFVDNCFKIIQRHALHANTLGFIHPTSQKEISFESELPEDMVAVIDKWRDYTHNLRQD